ncbi:HINT domain-containing protein [Gemmata sp. JC673]|uniref:HINT domain-containing protein n=1 Tax=Gemmata algarum TaxID=2975278 RepID=A0ABU5F6D2_9BACT|nr:HINT domain-containing protein [Gemmata algarum]
MTRRGWVAVELLGVGDEVASRTEHDPSGPVEWKPVEDTFRRTGRVLHLHFAGGELIRTTPEHPLWVDGKGWTAAGSLAAGDRIATLSGEWVPITEVYDTQEWEPVYNLRVADHHTYFVGDDGWGFAAWAHNTYYNIKVSPSGLVQIYEGNLKDAVAKAKGAGSLEKAAYYLANLQSSEAGFNQVLDDIRAAIGRSTNAAVKAVTIRKAASELRILSPGTADWQAAVEAIRNPTLAHGTNFRVAGQSQAQQLIWDAYDGTPTGRLPLRKPEWSDTWQNGRYEFGYQFDEQYEGTPKGNTPDNNLLHIKWTDNRTDGGHVAADGHIYYGSWSGPHQFSQPADGW